MSQKFISTYLLYFDKESFILIYHWKAHSLLESISHKKQMMLHEQGKTESRVKAYTENNILTYSRSIDTVDHCIALHRISTILLFKLQMDQPGTL